MSTAIEELLAELRRGLQALYRGRLRGVYLFGSYARGEAAGESDVDVLIILDEVASYGAEIARTSELTSAVSLRYGVSVSRVFASQREWQKPENPFLGNVHEEAIPV